MEKSLLAVYLLSALCVGTPTFGELLCLEGDFDHQVAALMRYIRLPHGRLSNILQVPKDLERLFQTLWPGCKVMAYGSTITGLALQSSDIDCFVDIPGDAQDHPRSLATEALAILENNRDVFNNFRPVLNANVPLLTCVHIPSNTFVDITFSGSFVFNSSVVLSYLLQLDQRALELARIVKYWGSVHNISNGQNTLPSYAMAMLTVFYLQQKGILPTVALLQENEPPVEVANWNTAFQEIEYHTDNNDTLYELLGGFFKYYSNFDFENTVISTYVGHTLKKEDFYDLDKLEKFPIYKRNLAKGIDKPFLFGYINIQDSLKHNENIARPKIGQWLSLRFIRQLRAADKLYDTLSSTEFLTTLLVPERRVDEGSLTTFWSGGVGGPQDCKQNQHQRIR